MPYESHHTIDQDSYLLRAVHRRGYGLSDFKIGEILVIPHSSYLTWDDPRINVSALKFSGIGTDPEIIAWKTDLILRCFDNSEALYFETQIPHNYCEGSDLKVHLHWTPHTRGAAEVGATVAWGVKYVVVSRQGTFGSVQTADLTDTCGGVDDKHETSPEVTVDGTGLKMSSMIIGKVYRGATDTWATDTSGNRPALLELDFHYQIDSLGSVSYDSKE